MTDTKRVSKRVVHHPCINCFNFIGETKRCVAKNSEVVTKRCSEHETIAEARARAVSSSSS
jgi:hypothetical protein